MAEAKAAQERELAESRASLEIGGSLVARELEQISELYGPLHALFGQSNALYRQMNEVLCELEPQRFRLLEEPDQDNEVADFDNRDFQILIDGQWVRFRTVLHMGEVYGRRLGIEDYFDEIVAIGERIQRIIADKAGYARPDDSRLLIVFGKYLAHYAILRRLHLELRERIVGGGAKGPTSVPMKVQESAVFPREIQGLVKNGFKAITEDLMEWRRRATLLANVR